MGFSTTAAAAEYVSRGPMGARGLYSTKRKYSLSDMIVWQDRKWNIFDNILRQELKTIVVDDPEPKLLTKQETPIKFKSDSNSTTTTLDEDTLRLSDADAKFLQQGDVLICNEIFCDSDGAGYSTDKFDESSSVTYYPEMMIVDSVTLSGAASAHANVIVKRGNGACPSATSTVTTDYHLIKIGTILEDGGSAATSIWHEPTDVQNYCQFFSKTWTETSIESQMNVYGKETMQDKAVAKRKELFREIDAALISGRQWRDVVSGQRRWFTGGIMEYVPNSTAAIDSTSRLFNFAGAFDLDTFREKMEIAFRYGSQEKVAFCGGKFFTVLTNKLEKFIVANDGLSKKWGWTVLDLETGHGIVHLMRHPLLTEFDSSDQGWAYDMIGIDLDYVQLMIMKGHDVQVKTGVEENDAHTKKNEIFASLGLRRSHPTAHFLVYGITG